MSGQFGESHWVETFPGKGNAGMFTEIRETGVAGNTYSHAEQNRNNVSAGTSMVHKLKREGGELSASFDYFHYYRVGNQLMDSFKPDTLKGI